MNDNAKPHEISLGSIVFTLFANWDAADVDVMLAESGSPFQSDQVVRGDKTPTSGSIERVYDALFHDKQLQAAGVTLDGSYTFCQGCARADFKVELDYADLTKLKPKVRIAERAFERAIKKHVRFYGDGQIVRAARVGVIARAA